MLFNNPKKAILLIAVFLALILAAFATTCRSAELNFESGASVMHGHPVTIGLSVDFAHQYDVGVDAQDFNFQCGVLLKASARGNPNNIGVQCLVVDGFGRFDLGIGPAYLQNTDSLNGSHLNFSLLARYRFTNQISLVYRHWSNAGTKMPNVGSDMTFIAFTF